MNVSTKTENCKKKKENKGLDWIGCSLKRKRWVGRMMMGGEISSGEEGGIGG